MPSDPSRSAIARVPPPPVPTRLTRSATASPRRASAWSPIAAVGLALLGFGCSGNEPTTSLVTRTVPASRLAAPNGVCQGRCALFDGPGVLYSALADPDSTGVAVELGRTTLSVVAGDSLMVHLAADPAVLASIVPAESLFVETAAGVVGLPLAAAAEGAVVLRFEHADSMDVSFRLNRALPAVTPGRVALALETSAQVLAMRAEWARTETPGAARLMSASNPACEVDISVSYTQRLCETDVKFIQAVPADAFLAQGATFQSDPGHGQSHQIVIDFSVPVLAVEVTAYDPTWSGNTMFAMDASAAVVGQHAFVGNQRPGVFSMDTYRATGLISRVILTPVSGEYIAYSMKVRFNPVDAQPITLTPAQTGLLSPYVPRIQTPGQCNVTEQRFHRNYTVLVQRQTPSGLVPAANQVVDLSLRAIDGSGGHIHTANRPVGSFVFGPDSTNTRRVTTGADGRATFVYYPPEQGGKIVLKAESEGSRDKVDTISVGLPLQQLAITEHMTDEGDTQHHTDNHWVTAEMATGLTDLADSIHKKFNLTLGVNDESLPMGGQFDNSGEWAQPHCSHRNGRGADVQTTGRSAAYRRFLENTWKLAYGADNVHAEANHPHLKTPR